METLFFGPRLVGGWFLGRMERLKKMKKHDCIGERTILHNHDPYASRLAVVDETVEQVGHGAYLSVSTCTT
jgi:hypothetical protein